MKILAINGSPKGKNSNTDLLLQPFLKGAGQAGAAAETVYLSDCSINHCTGCMSCWHKTPGSCVQKDDMDGILDKLRNAQLIVYASPLYVYSVTGLMKNFMDRCLPLVTPQMIKDYGKPSDEPSVSQWPKKTVVISNSGFPVRELFSPLTGIFRTLFNNPFYDYIGEILCPAGPLLTNPDLKDGFSWYIDALAAAGTDVVLNGKLSEETQTILNRDLATSEILAKIEQAMGIKFS